MNSNRPLFFVLYLTLLTTTAFAQNFVPTELKGEVVDSIENVNSSSSKVLNNVEKIEVTGSHIKRIDVEGPSLLTVIDREDIDYSGVLSVEDLLKENPYFEEVYGSTGHIRFHGQHAGNTLILLNGIRLPKDSGGYFTNISFIPTSAIEKVELLKSGSSALYGSDAMAGVVNFITKKNYDGASFSTQHLANEKGAGYEQSYTGSYGRTFRRGSAMLVAQYRKVNPIKETDLGSTYKGLSETMIRGSYFDFKSSEGKRATVGPKCANGQVCKTSHVAYSEYRSEQEDISTLASARYEFSESTELSVMGLFSRKNEMSHGRPAELRGRYKLGNFETLNNKPQGLDPSQRVLINGTFDDELGPLVSETTTDTYSGQAQLHRDFGDTWSWKILAGISGQQRQKTNINGDAHKGEVIGSLGGQWQPLNRSTGGSAGSLDHARTMPTWRNQGQMINTKWIASGELMDLGDGVLSMALGAELEHESFTFNHDDSIINNQNLSFRADNYKGFRRVQSGFIEFGATPLSSLEIQAAGRFDSYNDVGDTFNPKLAIAYRPKHILLLRSSVGTGFKPPGVSDMFAPAFPRFERFNNSNTGQRESLDATVVRNKEITFETSTHYNFGMVLQPTQFLSISLDQWNFEGRGTISNFRGQNAMEFLDGATPSQIDEVSKYGLDIVRASDGSIESMSLPNVFNRHTKILRGVDFAVNYDGRTRLFGVSSSIGVDNTVSHIFERKERTFSFSKMRTFNNYGSQNTLALSVGTRSLYNRFAIRTLINGSRGSARDNWDHPVYSEADYSISYTTKWKGQFSFGVKNLFDTQPYYDKEDDYVQVGYTSSSVFSPLGRRLFVGYSQDI